MMLMTMTPFMWGVLLGALVVAPVTVVAGRWAIYGIKLGISKLKGSKLADQVEDIIDPGNDEKQG